MLFESTCFARRSAALPNVFVRTYFVLGIAVPNTTYIYSHRHNPKNENNTEKEIPAYTKIELIFFFNVKQKKITKNKRMRGQVNNS